MILFILILTAFCNFTIKQIYGDYVFLEIEMNILNIKIWQKVIPV